MSQKSRCLKTNLVVNNNGQFYGYVTAETISSWKNRVEFRDGAWFRYNNEGGNIINQQFGKYQPYLCCVCGTHENLTIHHILPRCFKPNICVARKLDRKYVVICEKHHIEYEHQANIVKALLFKVADTTKKEFNRIFRQASWIDFVELQDYWEEHFLSTMKPKLYKVL